ncbi:MAG: hypothetical protein IAE96_04265 [Chitinophagaceae bacterium]|nr:hypothetical protein [Chitinophagaceae bacterium]
MKRLISIPFLFLLILLSGCKKAIQNAQEDLVVRAMADGQWRVSNFVLNGTTLTSDFSTYRFKFYTNRTVDAIKNGITEQSGTWEGNAAAMTMQANFPASAAPVSHLNGTWLITRNSWTYVEAGQSAGSDSKILRLDKD